MPTDYSKDKMTGKDLIEQEKHEEEFDRKYFKTLDRVDRRDKRGEIVSDIPSRKFLNNYERIFGHS